MSIKYRVRFDRIEHATVEPLACEARDLDDLAWQIFQYAKPHLRSGQVRVAIRSGEPIGYIFTELHRASVFTFTQEFH